MPDKGPSSLMQCKSPTVIGNAQLKKDSLTSVYSMSLDEDSIQYT